MSLLPPLLALAMLWSNPLRAQDTPPAEAERPARPITFDGRLVIDVMGVAAGGDARGVRVLDNLEISVNGDLSRLVGWRGARVRLHGLSNQGRTINDLAGTLQGVDNIEVAEHRTKLYEVWIEQSMARGRASLLVGLADLNAEFYQNDSAALLIAPAFGVGSELAATGPNGPSIFPSTALTARLNFAIGQSGYARVAVVNARAGVLGDRSGIDWSLHDGALVIAEAGSLRGGKLAVGGWRYTRRQDDIHTVDPAGRPVQRVAMGAYLLVDQRISGNEARSIHIFLRAGLSDGATTPYHGGFQAGLLLRGVVPGRPDGQLSLGIAQAWLSRGFRDVVRDAGDVPGRAETGFELTYQDKLAPFLSVQPDIQYIHRAFAGGGRRGTVVLGLRLIASFSRG